jgi:hypothetical protein
VTLSAADPSIVAGMVVSGFGITYETTVTAVAGTTVTISQPTTSNSVIDTLTFLNVRWAFSFTATPLFEGCGLLVTVTINDLLGGRLSDGTPYNPIATFSVLATFYGKKFVSADAPFGPLTDTSGQPFPQPAIPGTHYPFTDGITSGTFKATFWWP